MFDSMHYPNLEPLTHQESMVVEENINLVRHVMKSRRRIISFTKSVYDDDDWLSIGVLALCAAAKTYEPERKSAFSTYAFQVINNQYNFLKKYIDTRGIIVEESGDTHLPGEEETLTTFFDATPSSQSTFADELIEVLSVQEAYNSLTPNEQQVLYMSVVDGKSLRRIEKETGIGRMTVSKTIHNALAKMKRRLQ